jgi:AcrR family transcriptional regulator
MINRVLDSKAAILDAAEELFATRGFAATTTKQIGARSGHNTALIYYYFDSKASLYSHVLDRIFDDLRRESGARMAPDSSPEDVIRAVVAGQVAVLSVRPHLPQLMAREILDWQAANAESAVRVMAGTLFDRLGRAIEHGQREGRFRAGLDVRFAAISVISQVAYLLLARPITGILLGRGTSGPTPADIESFARHAADFSLAALQARSPVATLAGASTQSPAPP